MTYISRNPATGQTYATFQLLTDAEAQNLAKKSRESFVQWKKTPIVARVEVLKKLAMLLKSHTNEYGELATQEMGKPLAQAIAEVEKCALVCEYYAENAQKFLAPDHMAASSSKNFIRYDPLGVVLLIMPWNFPFWQVLRAAIPAIAAGNTILLKHSRNVPRCAQAIEELFNEAHPAFPILTNLFVSAKQVELIVSRDLVDGISLTGSTEAGVSVGATAGKHLKKTVLELGGSDPFIVLADADIEKAVAGALLGRFQNNGQSCIAAKRFILHESIANKFIEKFVEGINSFVIGDPMDPRTNIGPLVSIEALDHLLLQVKAAKDQGARILCGGKKHSAGKAYLEPTAILLSKDLAIAQEEFFGPVALLFLVASEKEAIELANGTKFGLGASIWTKNSSHAEVLAEEIDAGFVAINSIVKSDPKLPFGGTKKSGLGRELSEVGIKEFVNIKTVVVG